MSGLLPLPADTDGYLRFWLRWGEAMAAWHRYRVLGIENLDTPGPKLILGYHGRGVATDALILGCVLYHRHGRLPRSFIHAGFLEHPRGEAFVRGLRFFTEDGPEVQQAVDDGESIILLPGGTREANRTWQVRYEVDWGDRTGFVKFALKYKLPIVPIAAAGVDSTWIGLNDGYEWSKKLDMPSGIPPWLALGPLAIIPYPPFPVRVLQIVGEPIDLAGWGDPDPNDRDALVAVSHRVQAAVQSVLDEARVLKKGGRLGQTWHEATQSVEVR